MARFLLIVCLLWLAGCGLKGDVAEDAGEDPETKRQQSAGKITGEEGIVLFSNRPEERTESGAGGTGIGVNGYLWRASLDTLSFLPLASADPFGGVIITEWYSPPEAQNERYKLNIYILSRTLRSDGIRISVFKEVFESQRWVTSQVSPQTATKLEDAILQRAREIRLKTQG